MYPYNAAQSTDAREPYHYSQYEGGGGGGGEVNPLITLKTPNRDQHQILPCNVSTYSTPEVTGVNNMIT